MALIVGPAEAHRWIQNHPEEKEVRGVGKTLMDALLPLHCDTRGEPRTQTLVPALPPLRLGEPSTVLMGRTQNGSVTFKASGSSCLDFFVHVHQLTPAEDVRQRLELAWAEDPLTALKLVMQLRGVRDTGKSDRAGFFAAAMWLHEHHPQTLLANLALVPKFGCFKDLLVLVRRVKDQDPEGLTDNIPKLPWQGGKGVSRKETRRRQAQAPGEVRVLQHREEMQRRSVKAAEQRHEKRAAEAAAVLLLYESDARFRALHDEVGRIFAEALRADLRALERYNAKHSVGDLMEAEESEEKPGRGKWLGRKGPRLSLAAKWAPSLDGSFDRRTLLAESIARQFFGTSEKGAEGASGFALRDRLRKEVLVPLRAAMELPECYMSARCWDELPYGRVAAVCMKNSKKLFLKHDKERFGEYLSDVRSGKAKVAAGAVLPHEVLREARDRAAEPEACQVAELQWQRLVADVKAQGTFSNCIAVCDVSLSMYGKPLEVAVALSLLISEISVAPWKGHVITFSAQPQIHRVVGETVVERAQFTERMDWGQNTNFQAVFDRLLERARRHRVPPSGMVQRLYVFSDMEFDVASGSDSWATDHEEIVRKYKEAGYPVPEIVFWNLNQYRSGSTPVCMSQPGTALVSGFSKNILKAILQGKEISPMLLLEEALKGELYVQLKVVD